MRIALVVHPTRPVDAPLETVRRWVARHSVDAVQVHVPGSAQPEVAPRGEVASGDVVVALGGDGTVLSALRAAAHADAPVLGIACGSLGALAAVTDGEFEDALDRVEAGDWTPRPLPALAVDPAEGASEWAMNDFVLARRGAGQLVCEVSVDGELYVRIAGDGVIVATPLGSTAYSMAAGGPVVLATTPAIVCTPLAMHGGSGPPLVVPGDAHVELEVHPGFAGFDAEIDGHVTGLQSLRYTVSLRPGKVTLVSFGGRGLGLRSLRERRLIMDSPRLLARDERESRD
jgi:NAD+ kinase